MKSRTRIVSTLFAILLLMASIGAALGQDAKTRSRVLELSLHPYGFAARTVRVPPGRLLIIVNNLAGLTELHMRVEGANAPQGQAIVDAVAPRAARRAWAKEVALPPGEYWIRETSQELWKCRLIVADK